MKAAQKLSTSHPDASNVAAAAADTLTTKCADDFAPN